MTGGGLSKPERIAMEAILQAADDDQPCPTNLDIEMLIGYESCSMGSLTIQRLEAKGLIIVHRFQRYRIVHIVATGQTTMRPASAHTDRPHVGKGCGGGSRPPRPTDRKGYKRGRL